MSDKVVGFLGILVVLGGLGLSIIMYLARGGEGALGSLEFELAVGGCMLIVLAGGILGWSSQKHVTGKVAALLASALLGFYVAQRVPDYAGVIPKAAPATAQSTDAAGTDDAGEPFNGVT